MTFTLTFAWWQVPLALAVLVFLLGMLAAFRSERADSSPYNFVPAFIGYGTLLVTVALLLGALCAWLAGR